MPTCRLLAIALSASTFVGAPWAMGAQSLAAPSSESPSTGLEELEQKGSDRARGETSAIGGGLKGQPRQDLTDQPGDTSVALPASDISKTELTLGLSAFLVALTTFVFGAAMTIVGYLSFAKYREAEQKLDTKFTELEEARQTVSDLDRELDAKIGEVRQELERQERMAFENHRFFEAARGELFDLLVGIVENVRHALGSGQETELKALIGEAEACLSLFSPDMDEVTRALWRLEKVGSAKCISPLKSLVEDSGVDPEMRLRAQHALHVVIDRLDERGDLGPEPGTDGEAQEGAKGKSGATPDEPS